MTLNVPLFTRSAVMMRAPPVPALELIVPPLVSAPLFTTKVALKPPAMLSRLMMPPLVYPTEAVKVAWLDAPPSTVTVPFCKKVLDIVELPSIVKTELFVSVPLPAHPELRQTTLPARMSEGPSTVNDLDTAKKVASGESSVNDASALPELISMSRVTVKDEPVSMSMQT